MMFDELEAKLVRLMSFPLKSQIKIDFDQEKKTLQLSIAIYRSGREMPLSVRSYVQARQGMTFKPHHTSFRCEQETVQLVQEIPFERGFQQTLRQQTQEFWQVAKACYQMLMEIAAEERLAAYPAGPLEE
ncbi:MAG TPA: hypothetical protein VHL30_01680 [Chlamydiales bacterium]|jgi:hypothetical protein|nr:hypothetical protein [Chlamydiales bacterium]